MLAAKTMAPCTQAAATQGNPVIRRAIREAGSKMEFS